MKRMKLVALVKRDDAFVVGIELEIERSPAPCGRTRNRGLEQGGADPARFRHAGTT